VACDAASKFSVEAMTFLYVKKGNLQMGGAVSYFRYDGILGLGPAPRLPGSPKVFVQELYD